jgi:large subunit ribosomal protein L5
MIGLKEKYQKETIPFMKKKFGYKSYMAVPKIEKVVVNVGFGRMIAGKSSDETKKIINSIVNDLGLITGQKAVLTKARKSISGFKLRAGVPVGVKVTLRRKKMFDFLERLIHITLPRSRDFGGIKLSSFDKKGNLTLAIKEHISFPEILPEKTKQIFSLEITTVTNARNQERGIELLKSMGFPIKV